MSFIRIETVFENPRSRNVRDLSMIYNDHKYIREKISLLFGGILDKNSVSGKKIFIKPNWVTHDHKTDDEICLRTNDSLIIGVLEIILDYKPSAVTIGDAPIQGCNWDRMIKEQFYSEIRKLSRDHNITVTIKDLRRTTFDPAKNIPLTELNPISDYVIFDLHHDSLLEPISSEKGKFRVVDYNSDGLAESHKPGHHKYCITREFFDADIVISIPKIKTHQKTGITGALKNLVGLNGDKNFLPHHREGGTAHGGDCYPGGNILRRFAELALDKANRHQGKIIYYFLRSVAFIFWKLSFPDYVHQLSAGWYGNDTCWRMVMDLNKIAVYGRSDGILSQDPLRKIYSLSDGIIAGQGDGPLNPDPLPLGVISFSDVSSMNDICMAVLMCLDITKIPLLNAAIQGVDQQATDISLNGRKIVMSDLSGLAMKAMLPPGWIDYLSAK
jgi:uncharacterized protein (DUF362 family)